MRRELGGGVLRVSCGWIRPTWNRWLGGGCRGGEVSELGANGVDHGEDKFFDLLRLDLGFGEELGGAEAELGHLDLGDLAAGVDDQREGAEGGLLAQPLDEREAV